MRSSVSWRNICDRRTNERTDTQKDKKTEILTFVYPSILCLSSGSDVSKARGWRNIRDRKVDRRKDRATVLTLEYSSGSCRKQLKEHLRHMDGQTDTYEEKQRDIQTVLTLAYSSSLCVSSGSVASVASSWRNICEGGVEMSRK